MATTSADGLSFDPPGPGSWARDPVHFPRPATRYWAETQPAAGRQGTRDFSSYYGMLFDSIEMAYVNGFAYSRIAPPPDAEIPQRFQRAEEVFQKKLWREQLREWDDLSKPAAIAASRDLQAIDPDRLTDGELVAYLTRCRNHHAAMLAQHMRFTGAAMLPTGDFLTQVGDWTGLPSARLLGLLRGSADVSAGGSAELERLTTTLRADPEAMAVLASAEPPDQVLATLRALPTAAGAAVSGYLDLVGYRLLDGFDICEPFALEMPDALLRAIRVAVSEGPRAAVGLEEQVAEVREAVPAAHRAEFDDLLAEARLTYRLRDERGIYSDIWASGLMRRAALASGRRLVARGRIHAPEHMIEAGFEEMCSLLSNSGGPSGDDLAARLEYRSTQDPKVAPPILGSPPPPPPDLSQLPPAMARLMRATGLAMEEMFRSSQSEHEEFVLRGLAASQGVYEGPARRVAGPSEFHRIVRGDVLVTESTSEAFNILLPLLGGIVTDHGGLLSHSAIVAREYGIPGVVGTRDATQRIPDGTRVRVDGDRGEVTVLT